MERFTRMAALAAAVATAIPLFAGGPAGADPPASPPLREPVFGTDVQEAGVRNFPDPSLLRAEGRWFAFSSNSTGAGSRNIGVIGSSDLWNWEAPRGDQPTAEALPSPPTWARGLGQGGSFWAPSVMAVGDHYVLYFAARHRSVPADRPGWCVGAARAAAPGGPYRALERPVVCRVLGHGSTSPTSRTAVGDQGLIDPSVYRAPGGGRFLVAKALGRGWQLQGMRLSADGLRVQGSAHGLLYLDGHVRTWEYSEQMNFSVLENPSWDYNPAARGSGAPYVLFYAGGEWRSRNYATGYARCRSPLGPCTKVTTGRPWLRSSPGVAGPGGLSVVRGTGGQKWAAYHSWAPDAVAVGEGRRLHIEPLTYRGADPALQNRSPAGTFTAVSDLPGTVTFSGGARDPDTGRPVPVTIREDGVVVAQAQAVGGRFEASIQTVDLGRHRYCATFADDHRATNGLPPCQVVDVGV